MISDVDVTFAPKTKFPIVSWRESRGAFAPEAFGKASITCSIKRDAEGVLYFVARGTVREGSYEEGRQWTKLKGFKPVPAERLYTSPHRRAELEQLLRHTKTGSMLLQDHAFVVLADFEGESSIHVNCAVGSKVELDKLALLLSNTFANPDLYFDAELRTKFGIEVGYDWPKGDDSVPYYAPESVRERSTTVWTEIFGWLGAIVVVAGAGAAWWWLFF